MTLMERIIIILIFALIGLGIYIGTTDQAKANQQIKNALIESGVAHIYVHNREDGVADSITIFNKDDLVTVCSIPGVSVVRIGSAMHGCEPN